MRLALSERKAVTKELKKKYKSSSNKQKGEILDWLMEVAGYNRNYAARLLRDKAKAGYLRKTNKQKPGPKRTYDEAETPYRKLLVYETISQSSRDKLKKEYLSLNPAKLNREIESLRKELYQVTEERVTKQ